MKCSYVATFEFDGVIEPLTTKGQAEGGGVRAIAARAVAEARKIASGRKWHSLVLVLEKLA